MTVILPPILMIGFMGKVEFNAEEYLRIWKSTKTNNMSETKQSGYQKLKAELEAANQKIKELEAQIAASNTQPEAPQENG